MVTRMPRLLRNCRSLRALYPLSPTKRLGRRLGCPRLARLTPPWFSNCSTTVASCCWPGVSTKVIKCPLAATRMWIFVLNPPRLRPNASASAQLFSPLPRVDGLARLSRPRSGSPSRLSQPHLLAVADQTISGPRRPPFASAENGYTRSAISRIAPANPATARRSWLSRSSRSALSGGHSQVVPYGLSAVATMAAHVPTAHRSIRVVGSFEPVYLALTEFAYTP
jgi:hypothetical protein